MACILEMVLAFLDMYRSHIKDKRFSNMEYEWMKHIKCEADETPLVIREERKCCGTRCLRQQQQFGVSLSNHTKLNATSSVNGELCFRKLTKPYTVETCRYKVYYRLNLQYNSQACHIEAH